jgi:hypothetical protein
MMTLVKDHAADVSTDASPAHGVERRRGLRIAQNRPVKVFEPTSARYIPGQTEDVSATGLRVELPASAPVRPGKLINIHVGLSASGQSLANRRSMMPARIVWVDRWNQAGRARTRSGTMSAGLEFVTSIAAHLDAA